MMRVAILASLLGVEATGQSAAAATTAARLAAAGESVSILAPDCSVGGGPVTKYVSVSDSVRIQIFPSVGKLNRRIFRSPALTAWLRQHIDEFDILDVQGTWSFVGKDAAEVFAAAGKPYVLTPHGMMTQYDWQKSMLRRKLFFRFGFGRVWRDADAIRFLSKGERENSYYPAVGRSAIIPNAVEIQPLATMAIRSEARRRLGIADNTRVLLFVGRLTDQKGVKEMLAAFEIVAAQIPDLVFYLVGPHSGRYGEEAVAQANASAYRERIVLPGAVFGEAKYDYLRAADAFITLSHNEGQSVAHLEAMAEGLPMILTSASNMDYLLEYGAGVLTAHEPDEAAAAIVQVLRDEKARAEMGLNARHLVEERYTPQVVIPQLVSLYRELIGVNRRGCR